MIISELFWIIMFKLNFHRPSSVIILIFIRNSIINVISTAKYKIKEMKNVDTSARFKRHEQLEDLKSVMNIFFSFFYNCKTSLRGWKFDLTLCFLFFKLCCD